MTESIETDLCVIGAGAGGLSVAAAAAAFGVPVVLIERGKMGGDCLNYGCVPSKALIAAAKRAKAVADAPRFGILAGPPVIDFAAVHAHVHRVIAAIAPNDSAARFTGLGARVLCGHARFEDPETVVVDGQARIKARRFVAATGSSPIIPPIPGLAEAPYLTNETIFDLTALPPRLIVIGAGAIGLELAQAFRRLGSEVVAIEAAAPLGKNDPECAGIVLEALRREGVTLRAGQSAALVKHDRATGEIAVVVKTDQGEETIAGSHLLVAVGRKPNIDDLGLERAGVAVDRNGIVVDKGLRTTNRRVYAIGDAAGGPQFTHVANYHAGLVIRNALFRLPVRADARAIPFVTFTDPELAQVGLTEAEARRQGVTINVLRWPYHENDRAQTARETHGHIKAIVNSRGRILGAAIVGAEAGELIATWALAVQRRMNIRAFAELTVAYPTRAEIGKRAAVGFYARSLTNPLVRRMITWLRRLG